MRKIIKIILIVLWMGLIFMFSNDTGVASTKKSDGVIVRTVQKIIRRDLTSEEKEKVLKYLVVPVRKGAHLGVYLILGLLMISLVREYLGINTKALLVALFICILYACSDEVHQLFVVGRSCEVKDMIIDSVGSGVGITLYYLGYLFRKKHNTN
ncbi:MAG: VanZ family protein [Tenericutes bacterium]|nr:VanZ family protein [Mycoplasmatota bacterium]